MPQPTATDVHVDALLTNVSVAYRNNNYIADQIFPVQPVTKQSNLIASYDQSPWYRDEARLRAPGTKSHGGGFTVDTSLRYFCVRYSYRKEIHDEDRDNADSVFNLDADASQFVTDKIQMKRETAFVADFFKTSVWGSDKTAGVDFTAWSDYANSTPLNDMVTFKEVVDGVMGYEPNTLVLGKQVWDSVRYHPDLVDLIKYTQRGTVTLDMFGQMIEIPKILLGKTIKTASPEGTAEASVTYSRVWGKNGLLLWLPESPSLLTPAAGYTFIWQRVPSALQYIKRFRDEERETDIIEGNSYFDQKLIVAKAGVFLSGVVA